MPYPILGICGNPEALAFLLGTIYTDQGLLRKKLQYNVSVQLHQSGFSFSFFFRNNKREGPGPNNNILVRFSAFGVFFPSFCKSK